MRPSILAISFLSALAPAIGCSGGTPASTTAEAMARGLCPAPTGAAQPLVFEWSSAERGKLESLRDKHVVAARYNGCELEVLPQCQVPARYSYVPLTVKREHVRIRDEGELFANVPIYAVKIAAKLRSLGELNVKMTVVGRYEAERGGVRLEELTGECSGATHLVTGLTTGAFRFYSGSEKEGGGSVGIAGVDSGGSKNAKREVLSEDGDELACAGAKGTDKAPPSGCGALVRLELVPLGGEKGAQPGCSASTRWDGNQCATVGSSPESCPSGTVFAGGRCIPTGVACPAGMRLEDAKGCVPDRGPPVADNPCPPGTHHEGAGCAADGAGPGPMVRIPGATFMMGSNASGSSSETLSPHYVAVKTFDLDVFEVTLAAFKACVDAGRCLPTHTSGECNWGKTGKERHPINCVTWEQAKAYCEWVGRRLPTEAEWEYAAVGQTGWQYPWGNERPDKTRGCDIDHNYHTCQVGSFPAGRSRFGVFDLAGTVHEWVADAYCYQGNASSCDPKKRVVRSGLPAAGRTGQSMDAHGTDLGFRCAR